MKTKPNEYDYFQTLNLNIFIPDTERINLIADVVLEKEDNPLKFFSFFFKRSLQRNWLYKYWSSYI